MIAANALFTLVALVVLALVLYGPWQWIWTEVGRHFVFEQRRKLFLLAADGRLNFDSWEYREIRESLNTAIRFAHELTWPLFLLLYFRVKKRPDLRKKSKVSRAIEAIEDIATREEVRKIIFHAHAALILSMFGKSPILLAGLPVYIGIAILFKWFMNIRLWVKCVLLQTGEVIQVEADRLAFLETNDRRHWHRFRQLQSSRQNT